MIPALTGAEKSRLRGLGQTLDAALKVGREGASPSVINSLQTLLANRDLVKVRFTVAERDERARLTAALAQASASTCVGAVGATALFYKPRPSDDPGAHS